MVISSTKVFRFACSDIRSLGPHSAMVAVSSFRGARDLLAKFGRPPDWRLEVYSSIKHDPGVRRMLWSGVLIGSVTLASILLRIFK